MDAVVERTDSNSPARARRLPRLLGWQGFSVATPDDWDLTGFYGTFAEGYLRADDSDALAVEIKWSTPKGRSAKSIDLVDRRNAFLSALRKAARKRRHEFKESEEEALRGTVRADRQAVGFSWSADRKARGVLWHCRTCGRVAMAQVLGDPSGRKGFSSVADTVLSSITCHGANSDTDHWSLYDLSVDIPKGFELLSAQLMNVYLRLTFQQGTARLSVEQWGAANVARGDRFLDEWLASNSRAEIRRARYAVEATEVAGHPAVRLAGGVALGGPMVDIVREAASLRIPATRFSAVGWECPESNKIHAVQAIRPARFPDPVARVAASVRCHARAIVDMEKPG
jgi:hypothetical protein